MNHFHTSQFSYAIGQIRKRLYIWNMNLHKNEVKPETKIRLRRELYLACKDFVKTYEEIEGD